MSTRTVDPNHTDHRSRRRRAVHTLPHPVAAGLVLGLVVASVNALPAPGAGAATQTVSNCNDSGTGSLRQAVLDAASGDTVTFSSLPCATITLASTITITTSLTIAGPGSTTLAVSGNDAVAVFAVNTGVSATISGLTVEDGMALAGAGIDNAGTLTISDSTVMGNNASSTGGGGIRNSGSLSISDSTVSDNASYHGGGGGILNNGGTVTVSDSTLSGNGAFYGDHTIGGGAIDTNGGTLTVVTSTLSGNAGDYNGGGGGILDVGGVVTVTASTFLRNTASRHGLGGGVKNEHGSVSLAASVLTKSAGVAGNACVGQITDGGYNLADDGSCGFTAAHHSVSAVNPVLGPLQNNGGPTETSAPALGSAVLDQIPPGTTGNALSLCPGTDQRGVARPQGPDCDMGAVELSPTSQEITSADSASSSLHASFSFTVTTSGTPVPAITEMQKLPKRLTFVDHGNGTAILSGVLKKAGVFHLIFKASYATGSSTYVVTQLFTLTVSQV
jgi:hypothetical protein